MQRILTYGDSNTWGYIPGSGQRYPLPVRWPGVMLQALGSSYELIEEGLNGRTTALDDPDGRWRNGMRYLLPCLLSHAPVDWVVLQLGCNDLKRKFYPRTAAQIAQDIEAAVAIIQASGAGPDGCAPKVLLISPVTTHPKIGELAMGAYFDGAESFARSSQFADCYRRVAQRRGCAFLDAAAIAQPSAIDGLHMQPDAHRAIGLAAAQQITAAR